MGTRTTTECEKNKNEQNRNEPYSIVELPSLTVKKTSVTHDIKIQHDVLL